MSFFKRFLPNELIDIPSVLVESHDWNWSDHRMIGKSKLVVQFAECFLVTWAAWTLVKSVGTMRSTAKCLLTCSNIDADYLWFTVASISYFVILPGAALASAYGSFKYRPWGRKSALSVCLALLGLGLYTAVAVAVIYFQNSGIPLEPIPQGEHVFYVSYWPAYITSILGGVVAWLLLQDSADSPA